MSPKDYVKANTGLNINSNGSTNNNMRNHSQKISDMGAIIDN